MEIYSFPKRYQMLSTDALKCGKYLTLKGVRVVILKKKN